MLKNITLCLADIISAYLLRVVMNQKLKQAGLFAILAVFTMSLTTSFVGDAEASKIDDRPENSPVELSSKAKHMTELRENLKVEASPSLQLITVHDTATKAGIDFVVTGDVATFTVVYAVLNPANIDLRNLEILVTSDTESVKGELIGDSDASIISVKINAVDPASVNAKIIG